MASTALALASGVPVGWLFEAPNPTRKSFLKVVGLTRGETQGSSLALFYRCFAVFLLIYALGWYAFEEDENRNNNGSDEAMQYGMISSFSWWLRLCLRNFLLFLKLKTGNLGNVVFFLVVHIMRLHGISLIWGVASEALEYEERAEKNTTNQQEGKRGRVRLKRLSFIGFGGTLGGIIGSIITSFATHILHLSGLLLMTVLFLELSANLSHELGNMMHGYWLKEQLQNTALVASNNTPSTSPSSSPDVSSTDISIKRNESFSSMKRVASGNSLSSSHNLQQQSLSSLADQTKTSSQSSAVLTPNDNPSRPQHQEVNEADDNDTFKVRLLRGITTILRSRLLMSIFTYNALYASTTVLLSFQRAELIANRSYHDRNNSFAHSPHTTTESHTAFLAKINTTSSFAVFVLQISGVGASIAHRTGMRGTLTLMPLMRLFGVLCLLWYHFYFNKQPNLILFLIMDEMCKVVNFAIAKPVRESLWRGLSVEARYEAKPIVDTLANRWGGGSAAFMVQFVGWIGLVKDDEKELFGFPFLLLMCLAMTLWWMGVSTHLGWVRWKIDLELKKNK